MKRGEIVTSKCNPYIAVNTPLVGGDGKEFETQCVYSLCRCGESSCKPFCDGSHINSDFSGERKDSVKSELEYYEGKDITIVYDRYMCMGAGYCGELEAVFGTHDKPVYKPDAAPVGEIIETIRKCPSGALSYIINGKHETEYYEKTAIVPEKDGPLNVQGNVGFSDDQDSGRLIPKGDHFCLCRCGESSKKPFCDGSHKKNNFKGADR